MILRNFWYVASVASEVGVKPLARIICNEPIVLYRTDKGEPAALRNLCSHRRAPLALGRTVGDVLECPYHGLRFDKSGRCVLIPSQKLIPPRAHIRSFPVEERHGFIWVWTGEASAANPNEIPDLPCRNAVGWNSDTIYYYNVKASHILMTDNLLDLGHVAFIHTDTIGFDASKLKDDPLVTKVNGDHVVNTRIIPDVQPGPNVQRWGNFAGLIERTSASTWWPPCFTSIEFRSRDEITNIELRIDHLITPETNSTHHYWVSISRNFLIEDSDLTKRMWEDNEAVHRQDLTIVEAQQRMIELSPGYTDMPIKQDRGLVAAHRILERLYAAEAQQAATATQSRIGGES